MLEVALQSERPIPLDVAFQCPAGAITALVGPSGAGKSTILRAIAGLHAVAEGRITCGGQAWLDTGTGIALTPQARRVGFVFQDYALFPHMTAAGNVVTALGHSSPEERRPRAEVLLAAVGLSDLADRKPASLSGGQRQRVALARALAREPAVLLLDEPFSAVDRGTRRRLHDLIADLHGSLPIPILLVTHDMAEVETLAERIVVLNGGYVLQAGNTADVLAAPKTQEVAEALGLP